MRAAPGCVCVSVRGCLSVLEGSGGCWRRGGGAAGSSQRPARDWGEAGGGRGAGGAGGGAQPGRRGSARGALRRWHRARRAVGVPRAVGVLQAGLDAALSALPRGEASCPRHGEIWGSFGVLPTQTAPWGDPVKADGGPAAPSAVPAPTERFSPLQTTGSVCRRELTRFWQE